MFSFTRKDNPYVALLATAFFLAIILTCAPLFQGLLLSLINITSYVVWHNIFELSSIVIAICIFCVAYFSFEQTRNFRFLFLGSMLLLMAFIDFFHTLSYKGMPDFLIPYISSNRATTFWIIARLIGGFAMLATSILPIKTKLRFNKIIFFIIPLGFSLLILIQGTYYPDLLPPMYIEGQGLTNTKILLEFVVMGLFLSSIFFFLRKYHKNKDWYYILLSCPLLIGIFSELSFTLYTDVYGIYNFLGHLLKSVMYFYLFRVTFIHNIKEPYTELSAAKDEIKNYADNLDKIVEQRTEQIKEINKKLLDDLEFARGIQRAMLPKKLPNSHKASFDACYYPAEQVGGDFYNVFQLEESKIGMYIGDVSGHGVSAAMLTVFLKQSIKTTTENGNGTKIPMLPSEVLTNLYSDFNRTEFASEVYIVMLYGIFDLISKEFTFASAGLNVPPMIVSPSGEVSELVIKGFPICKFPQSNLVQYYDSRVQLHPGEKILFYTDGLVDAVNEDKQAYADTRLKAQLHKGRHKSADLLANGITESVFTYVGNEKLHDDVTFFVMEVK